MFIEQIERLRCTSAHEETWLIATFIDVADRFIKKGKLGCYLCHREFLIEDGVAIFGKAHTTDSIDLDGSRSAGPSVDSNTQSSVSRSAIEANGPMGAAAFLNPSERSTIVLTGDWCSFANALPEIIQIKVFALNPSSMVSMPGNSRGDGSLPKVYESEDVSIVIAEEGQGIPLARGTVAGVALDDTNANQANLDGAVRVLVPGGRLVAPVSVPLPPTVTELARDENFWVAEKARELVMITR